MSEWINIGVCKATFLEYCCCYISTQWGFVNSKTWILNSGCLDLNPGFTTCYAAIASWGKEEMAILKDGSLPFFVAVVFMHFMCVGPSNYKLDIR